MHRIDGAGHINNLFVTEDVGLNRPPTEVTADILNAFQEELASFITWAGLALVKADNTQLRQALLAKFALSADAVTLPTIQAGAYVAAASAGSADAITGVFTPAITTLTHGMVLYVRASSANATAAPTFSPNGLTARAIVKGANAALVAGDIAGSGHWLALQYDATLLKWVLINPANGVVGVNFASSAEAQAMASSVKSISPASLAAALQGANQSLAASGYQRLPGGLILQWGSTAPIANGGALTVYFPLPFPNQCLWVNLPPSAPAPAYTPWADTYATASFVARNNTGGAAACNWLALGR